MSRALTALLLVFVAATNSACGILLQTAFGWTNEERRVAQKTHTITVQTKPEGLPVTRTGSDGTQQLGNAPITDRIDYQQEVVIETPSTAGLFIGGAVTVAAALASLVASAPGDEVCSDFEFDCGQTDIALALLGGTLMYFGLQDLVIGLFYGLSGEQVKSNRAVDPPTYTYAASMPGKGEKSMRIKVPDASLANLVVDGTAEDPIVTQAPPPPPPPPPPTTTTAPPPPTRTGVRADVSKWVIAVMDVEDLNAEAKTGIDRGLVRNLGDQLRIFIAQNGVRTIDRSAQERALKEVIAEAKSDSYKACYDDSCQVELGKALAATHILRSRITRFGSRCVLNAEMIDLRAEVTVKAASARGNCEAEGFLTMSEEVAKNLVE